MTRSIAALAALVALAAGAGCFGGSDEPPPDGHADYGSGRVFVAWTIGGAAPSASACAGVDHFIVSLDNGVTQVQISPVPCTLTRFRYDGLPEGRSVLHIDGVDGGKCIVTSGEAQDDVTQELPSTPSPTIALSAILPCH